MGVILRVAVTDSRTYEATPRQLARARRHFGRPTSPELTAAIVLTVVWLGMPALGAALSTLARALWSDLLGAAQTSGPLQLAFGRAPAVAVALAAGVLLLAVAVGAFLATWLQRGVVQRAAEPPRIARKSAAPTFLKGLVLALVLLWPWSDAVRGMVGSWQRAPTELLPLALRLGSAILERAILALLLLGSLDLGLSHLAYRRRLRMSRRELQDEERITEGDPLLRAERRRRAHDLRIQATLRELSEVSQLVYDESRVIALRGSVVWIKADGELAQRVLGEAESRAVPAFESANLVAALSVFEPNEELPAWLQLELRAADEGSHD